MIPIFIGSIINKCFSLDEKTPKLNHMLEWATRFILNVSGRGRRKLVLVELQPNGNNRFEVDSVGNLPTITLLMAGYFSQTHLLRSPKPHLGYDNV